MTDYEDVCYDCGVQIYEKRRDESLSGVTLHEGICPVCQEEKTIIPADDWSRRAGQFRMED